MNSTIAPSILDRLLPAPLLAKSKFTLDMSGIAGAFGGDEAMSAMAIVHVFEHRQWLGWYNSQGSYQIAKRFGLLARSRFYDAFSPGVHTDPATLFRLDGLKGSAFRAAHSGTILEETGHTAVLFMNECASLQGKIVVGERTTKSISLTIANLNHAPEPTIYPRRLNAHSPIFSSIPIFVSASTCAACGLVEDWVSFSLILLGIVVAGISCVFIGSGSLVFTHPATASGSPAGDGLLGSGDEVVLLKGAEGAVTCVTRGKFSLTFSTESQFRNLQWSSVLFTIQFLAQLLLIPQGTLFGQFMFVTSLAVSWIYTSWLSSSHEEILRKILLENVLGRPVLTKYVFSTRTGMVVFALLTLQPEEPRSMLDQLLPDTKVWRQWKDTIVQRLCAKQRLDFHPSDWELGGFNRKEKMLLKTLYRDAQAAYGEYAASNAPFNSQPSAAL